MIDATADTVLSQHGVDEIARLDVFVEDQRLLSGVRSDQTQPKANPVQAEIQNAGALEVERDGLFGFRAMLGDRSADCLG